MAICSGGNHQQKWLYVVEEIICKNGYPKWKKSHVKMAIRSGRNHLQKWLYVSCEDNYVQVVRMYFD